MWPMVESADQARIWLGKLCGRPVRIGAGDRSLRRHFASFAALCDGNRGAGPLLAGGVGGACGRRKAARGAGDSGHPILQGGRHRARTIAGRSDGPRPIEPPRSPRPSLSSPISPAGPPMPKSCCGGRRPAARCTAGVANRLRRRSSSSPWRAQGGRQNNALAELRAIGAASAEPMLAVLEGLSQIAGRSTDRARGPIARVQLAAVDMLAQSRDKLNREQQLMLDRVQAEGLAALAAARKHCRRCGWPSRNQTRRRPGRICSTTSRGIRSNGPA